MAHPDRARVKRWRELLGSERDAAALYSRLSVGGLHQTRYGSLPGPDFHRQATTSLRPEINSPSTSSLLGARKPEASVAC